MHKLITIVSKSEYESKPAQQKLLSVDVPNYFYRLDLGCCSYYFSTNGEIERGEVRFVSSNNTVILVHDELLHVFKYNEGYILLTLRLLDFYSQILYTDNFAIVIGETHIYQVELSSSILYRIEIASDIITDVQVSGSKLVVHSYDNRIIELLI